MLSRIILAVIIFACACANVARGSDTPADLQHARDSLLAEFADRIPRPVSPSSGMLVFVAPDQYANQRADAQVSAARVKYARRLFEIAQRAAAAGEASLAFSWASETAAMDPDHSDARRVLGYEKTNGAWRTPFAQRMADKGRAWHPQFGWSADDVDTRRRDSIDNGWRVRTDHFLVTTNHSLEAGVVLAAQLERLHQVWRQLFASFYLTEREVRQLFAGERHARQRSKPFRVFYHRTKDEYVAALIRQQPRIAETVGIYFDTRREAHFFADGDDHAATLYHEAVHQLFQESQKAARNIGGTANFWAIEGVALYFESLTQHDHPLLGSYFTIGEATAGRFPAARRRVADDEFFVPLAELVAMDQSAIQRSPHIAPLYSQSAGLATYFMHGESGQLREPLIRYLQAVYSGRDDAQSLTRLTGKGYAELDAAYRRFVQTGR